MQEVAATALFTDPNIVAYYKLENTSAAVGSALTNNGSVAFSPAQLSNGADFGASNSTKSLSLASNLGVGSGATSIVFWAKNVTAPSAATQTLCNIRSTGGGTNFIDWRVEYTDVAGTKSLSFVRSRPGVASDSVAFTITLGTTVFHHIALVYDGSNLSGYLDGVLVAGPTAYSGVGSGGADNFIMGALATTPLQPFSGLIDDFAVFTRALTQAEILNLVGAATQASFLLNFI